jgi:O-antigen/teichoic acid export membrane protein
MCVASSGHEPGRERGQTPEPSRPSSRLLRSPATLYTAIGVLEFSLVPLLSLALTPFLLHRFGVEAFGLWVTCNALILAVGVVSLGVPDWIVVKVGRARLAQDWPGTVSALWGDALVLGAGTGIVAIFFVSVALFITLGRGGVVSQSAFAIVSGLTLVGSALRSFEIILLGLVRGLDRWDLAGTVGISAKIANLTSLVGMAYSQASVPAILVVQNVIAMVTVAVHFLILKREIGKSPTFRPAFWERVRTYIAEARPFWAHVGVSAIVHSLDRVLVSAAFGLRVASGYAVCSQVTQQIYTLSWSGANWLVPRVARLTAGAEDSGVRLIVRRGWAIGAGFAVTAVLSAIALGAWFLRVWMGQAFALEWHLLLVVLSCAMALFALPIVPWYVVQAMGRASEVIPFYVWGTVSGALVFLLLQSHVGVESVALARGLVGLALGVGVMRVLSHDRAMSPGPVRRAPESPQ